MDVYELLDIFYETMKVTALDAGLNWDDDEHVAYDDNGEIVELW